jgi:hypothetical protein
MNVFRYPVDSLIGDYLRAGIGMVVGLSVLANAPTSVVIVVIFGGLTALFGGFAYRTLQRHLLRVAVSAEAIRGSGLATRELPWGKLDLLKLRYYGTRRQRNREAGGGFMQLTLKGLRVYRLAGRQGRARERRRPGSVLGGQPARTRYRRRRGRPGARNQGGAKVLRRRTPRRGIRRQLTAE